MLALRELLAFSTFSRASFRVLVVAFGLAFGMGAPIDAAHSFSCAVAGNCAVLPAEEPRESESPALSLTIAGHAAEAQQRVVAAKLKAAPAPELHMPIAASPFGERRDLRHLRGRENLPDKTGPPSA